MGVTLAAGSTPELHELWQTAWREVSQRRGGVALLETISNGAPSDEVLLAAIGASAITVFDDGDLKGFALCRSQLIEAVYVAHRARRQRVATTLVTSLLRGAAPPVDAYALPGDRATKSLYESIGWKARLLTMRGA